MPLYSANRTSKEIEREERIIGKLEGFELASLAQDVLTLAVQKLYEAGSFSTYNLTEEDVLLADISVIPYMTSTFRTDNASLRNTLERLRDNELFVLLTTQEGTILFGVLLAMTPPRNDDFTIIYPGSNFR